MVETSGGWLISFRPVQSHLCVLACLENEKNIKQGKRTVPFRANDQELGSPIQANEQPVLLFLAALILQVSKDLSEIVWISVDLQHFGTHEVDDGEATIPKCLFTALHQEGLERVGDLIAHIGIGEIEAGK